MRTRTRFGVALATSVALIMLLAVEVTPAAQDAARPVMWIRLSGAIDVPSAGYLDRALQKAQDQNAEALVVLLNTPGGLGDPMKGMVEALLNAPLPTVVYVYPAGGTALSAGTFVTLSAHVAAMHPATTIGAAHPVQLFATPEMPEEPPKEAEEEGEGQEEEETEPGPAEPSSDVMMKKIENAFALQARVIAEARGRNADWAEKAVRESDTITATQALEMNVVDVLPEDMEDLLSELDGRKVSLPGKRTVTLQTAGAPLQQIPATAKERFLHVLANPNVLLVLLVLAGLGVMFELQNPGAILPGVVGGLSLLLALYSMAVLPVNYAGVGLIIFSMLLFLAEVKVVSHGVLTVGGVAAFVLGALMLVDTNLSPALRVSWQVVLVMTVLLVLFFLFVIGAAIRAHRQQVSTGEQGMIGLPGRALSRLAPAGTVLVAGERWRARARQGEIADGEEVVVVGQDRFTLLVETRKDEAGAQRGS